MAAEPLAHCIRACEEAQLECHLAVADLLQRGHPSDPRVDALMNSIEAARGTARYLRDATPPSAAGLADFRSAVSQRALALEAWADERMLRCALAMRRILHGFPEPVPE